MLPLPDTEEDAPPPGPSPQSKAWLVTFTDMVSLILAFFVLLFSMSSVKIGEWENMVDALSRTLNPERDQSIVSPTAQFNIGTILRKRAINLDYLAGVLEETVRDDPVLAEGRVVLLEDRLIIALPGDLVFEPGRATMSEEPRKAVFNLGGVLPNVDNQISVHGHSDPTPYEGDEFSSNWDLSLARAAAVANALNRAGHTENIRTLGYADARYPMLPLMGEQDRTALARRVDIVVLPTVESR